MARILWRSWSAEYAAYEIPKLDELGLLHEWCDGHKTIINSDDVLLTCNGYDYFKSPATKATIYAEPYIYLRHEYDRFHTDNRWDVRFVYDHSLVSDNVYLLPIAGYWRDDIVEYSFTRHTTFGMVLSKKPSPLHHTDIGYLRSEAVRLLKNHNFKYWGHGWDTNDVNYCGEYYSGKLCSKFRDSQRLLSDCRFALAFDNSCIDGYLTEKFWNAMVAGCIPIYYGHHSIKQKIPNDLFVYGYDFESFEHVIDHCLRMSHDELISMTDKIRNFIRNDTIYSWDAVFARVDELLANRRLV